MNKINNKLEKEIKKLIVLSIQQPIDKSNILIHPIRVVESAKSLIGLNLTESHEKILSFLNSKNLANYTSSKKLQKTGAQETVSIYQLEKAIKDNDLENIHNIIESMLFLSDGRHILEYLLELSLNQSGNSLSVIWALYKSMNFIGYDNILISKNALILGVDCLLNDTLINSKKEDYSLENIFNNKDLSINKLHTLGLLFELSNNTFIREKLIHEKIGLFTPYLFKSLSINTNINTNKTFLGDRENLLDIISKNKVNDNLLLTLNALRAYMKNSKAIDRHLIQHYIDKFLE